MISTFLTWLRELPEAMKTWPERLVEWLVEGFWSFLAWLRDLPRRSKEFVISVGLSLRDLFLSVYHGLLSLLAWLVSPLAKFVQMRLDPDPDTIPSQKLRISQRGRKVAIYSRQLASMTQGGVPLLQSLDVLGEQADDPKLAYVSKQLATKLAHGYTLSKAVTEYPGIFPPVFSYLLRAGESTGRITNVIDRLADLLEKDENLLKQVKGALSYPLFVMGLTGVLTLGLFSTVLPGFADFYADFDVPLPMITAVLMTMTFWIQTVWFWLIFLLLCVGVFYLIKTGWANEQYRVAMFQTLLWIPLVGPIIKFSCLARFCWVMELTQDSGLDVVRSLQLASLASGSAIIETDYKRLSKGVTAGEYLSDLMKERPDVYPHLLQQMTMMGEETSQTKEAFGRAGNWFEQEVQGRVESFQAALEPILMGLISLVVGTIVLAVFLPLYGLLDKLGV